MKQRRVCPKGHVYFKSSDCPTCPRCEAAKKPVVGFMAELSAPARRALTAAGLTTLKKLGSRSEKQVLALHGMGPNAIGKLSACLKKAGLSFAKDRQ
jgi:hypothetical protein